MNHKKSLSYKDAGVDIEAGDALVRAIAPLAAATRRPGCDAELGGFGGLFDLGAAGYEDPILVAATDGVGTKLKIAFQAGFHETIGIDLVAMCVNDLIVQGAEPLFFLDYFATGKLSGETAEAIVAGIAKGCQLAGCALIGGETAEMPGMYQPEEYDLAGFSVGAMERGTGLDGSAITEGDVLLGLASDGLHSNGFSLVRATVEKTGLDYAAPAPFAPGASLAEALLTPTRIYVKSVLGAHRAGLLKGLAHITGGGLIENLPRILPPGLSAEVDAGSWELPPVFGWLQEAGNLPPTELIRTFNCGVGMVAVVAREDAESAQALLEELGECIHVIGHVAAGNAKPMAAVSGSVGTWGYFDVWRAASGGSD